jgi:alkylation response protein AidB-like acyl-CoA dehydrogenase
VVVTRAPTPTRHKAKGITAFLVEKTTPGVGVGKKELKCGIRGSPTVEIVLEDVPRAGRLQLLGRWTAASRSRSTRSTAAASASPRSRSASRSAAIDARSPTPRCASSSAVPIAHFQADPVEDRRHADAHDAARILVCKARRWCATSGLSCPRGVAMAEARSRRSDGQLLRRRVPADPRRRRLHRPLRIAERLFRDARITEIYEGATDIQRLVIDDTPGRADPDRVTGAPTPRAWKTRALERDQLGKVSYELPDDPSRTRADREQLMVRDMVRDFARTELAPHRTRDRRARIASRSRQVAKIVDLGLPGDPVPRGGRRLGRRHARLRDRGRGDRAGLRVDRARSRGARQPRHVPYFQVGRHEAARHVRAEARRRRVHGRVRSDGAVGRLGLGRHAHDGRARRRRLRPQRTQVFHHEREPRGCIRLHGGDGQVAGAEGHQRLRRASRHTWFLAREGRGEARHARVGLGEPRLRGRTHPAGPSPWSGGRGLPHLHEDAGGWPHLDRGARARPRRGCLRGRDTSCDRARGLRWHAQ